LTRKYVKSHHKMTKPKKPSIARSMDCEYLNSLMFKPP
jgi:hypothetical protein